MSQLDRAGDHSSMASGTIVVQTNSPREMDARLLALVCSGSFQDLTSFLDGQDHQASSAVGGSATRRPSGDDEEAFLRESLLDGITVGGDTVLHVVATNGDSEEFLKKAGLVHRKAQNLLCAQNNDGDTPLHCAAREGNFAMVSLLIDLARRGDDANANGVKALLRTENKIKWTALHEAIKSVLSGHDDMVELLMKKDPQLASFPKDGTSPLYLAILEGKSFIAETLYELSGGVLSYSGPNGQNVLHATVLRGEDPKKMLEWNNVLASQRDNNGRTPLHFAATAVLGNQKILSQVLKTNAEALYQPDHNGSFPIHMAASVGATSVVSEFIENTPNCAGLRDTRKMTFLHVAVDNKKISTVSYACKNGTLSWIFNMQDKNGNTAVHLAVQAGSVKIFCCLFRNRQVQLNLTNKKGETPLDIAYQNIPKGLHAYMHSEARILSLLQYAGAKKGIRHQDYLEKNNIVQKNQGEIDEMEKLKDATQSLCIGSVLIATVTFGAAFAMPGGYRADDHTNGGTPTLAGRYGFDAFSHVFWITRTTSSEPDRALTHCVLSHVGFSHKLGSCICTCYLYHTSPTCS
ncbi:hypothetical protein VPH35_107305 [Triticum aestivum]|uniref:ankyrin-1 n=1 Tax=Triticum aestivum TaxID=4565 RepID=UPI001D012C15|nr:ankyrin-1-like [Triticum aestivum]